MSTAPKLTMNSLKQLANIQAAEMARLRGELQKAGEAQLDASRKITRLQGVAAALSDGSLAIASTTVDEPHCQSMAAAALIKAGITPNDKATS